MLLYQMTDGHCGVSEQHSRAAVRHDLADFRPHSWLVALDGAGVTGSLVLVRAPFRPLERIGNRFRTFLAKPIFGLVVRYMAVAMAVDACHGHQSELILFQLVLTEFVCAGTVSHRSLSSRRFA